MHVAVTEGEDQYVEAVGELQEDGLDGESGNGMPPEAEDGRNGPPPGNAAGADVHHGQVAGNGQVADPSGPPAGSICKPSGIRSPWLRFPCNLCL